MTRTIILTLAIISGLGLAAWPGRAAPGVPPAGWGGGHGVQIVDLAGLVADLAREHADKSDISQSFYESSSASVHVHILGYEQTAPLHIHRATEEATVIVTGAPRVTLAFGRNGKKTTLQKTAGPGGVIYSPPFTAHEWFNPDARVMQANLVIASPPFDGNFYLQATDRRVLKGGEPLIRDPDEDLRHFLASGRPFRIDPLPMRREQLTCVFVSGEVAIPAHPASPTLIYVTRGEGVLLLDAEYPIRQQMLIEVPARMPIRVRAKKGAPLVMIAFRPEA